MKLYKTIKVKKETSITHSEKGLKYKRPKKRVDYVNKDVLVENPLTIISDSLNRGHLEEQLERMAKYLAALTIGDKNEMARHMDTFSFYFDGVDYRFED